jgi:hypothetical protein
MNYKKFINISLLSVLVFSITACTKNPESSFKKNLDLGYYDGMHITWIKDDSDTLGTGFYIIDDTHIDKKQSNNSAFETEKLVGYYGDLKIMWVYDHSDANSRGFYLFRNKDNKIVPSLTMAETFSNGKTNTTKNIGSLFVSNINSPSLQVKLDDKPYEETIKVSELSSIQLIQLSKRLLDIAQKKELENKNISKPKF